MQTKYKDIDGRICFTFLVLNKLELATVCVIITVIYNQYSYTCPDKYLYFQNSNRIY